MSKRPDASEINARLNEGRSANPTVLASFFQRFGDDLTSAENAATINEGLILLKRFTSADIGTETTDADETTLASVTLPAGFFESEDKLIVRARIKADTDSGAADFTVRAKVENVGSPGAADVEVTFTPAADDFVVFSAHSLLIEGTPFGGGGPDSKATYGTFIANDGTQNTDISPAAIDLGEPVAFSVTAQVSMADGSAAQIMDYEFYLLRRTAHPDAT